MHPYLNIAISAARRAGTIITRQLEKVDTLEIFEKGINDLVTYVDRSAEEAIMEIIYKAYPQHGIVAEESGVLPGNEFVWVIDPLDGTLNFTHGFPQFSISIAVLYRGVIEHAVIYDPISQDLYTASKGAGAQLNNRRIRVSNREALKSALIGMSFPCRGKDLQPGAHWESNSKVLSTLIFDHHAEPRKIGSAALNLAYVASGKLDGFYESGLKEWDIAAGILLVREAGGYVSDYQGEGESLDTGNIIAGTRRVHRELLKLVQENGVT